MERKGKCYGFGICDDDQWAIIRWLAVSETVGKKQPLNEQ